RSPLRSRQRRGGGILIPPRFASFSGGSEDLPARSGDRVVRLERRGRRGRSPRPRGSAFMAAGPSPAGALQVTAIPCSSLESSCKEFLGDRPNATSGGTGSGDAVSR